MTTANKRELTGRCDCAAAHLPVSHPTAGMCVCSGDGDRQANGAGPSGGGYESGGVEEQLLNSLAPAEVLARAAKPRWPLEQLQFLQMLAAKDPSILAQFGASPQVQNRKHSS